MSPQDLAGAASVFLTSAVFLPEVAVSAFAAGVLAGLTVVAVAAPVAVAPVVGAALGVAVAGLLSALCLSACLVSCLAVCFASCAGIVLAVDGVAVAVATAGAGAAGVAALPALVGVAAAVFWAIAALTVKASRAGIIAFFRVVFIRISPRVAKGKGSTTAPSPGLTLGRLCCKALQTRDLCAFSDANGAAAGASRFTIK